MRAVTACMYYRYESTSSESSSESSDDESDASEYHEATEKLPESPTHDPQATSVSSSTVSVPVISKSIETTKAQHSNSPLSEGSGLHSLTQSPALDTATCKQVLKSPTAMVPHETLNLSAESDSILQNTTQNTATCPEHSSIDSSAICRASEQTVNQPQATSSDSQQNSNQPESSGLTSQQPTALSHTTGASHPGDGQSQTTDLTTYQQTVQFKASDASDQQDTNESPINSPTENTSSNRSHKQESRCGTNSKFVVSKYNNVCYKSANRSLPIHFQRGTE